MDKIFYKILIAIITISVLGCGGAEERKKAYLEKAVKSYEEGSYDKARVDLKNVIQIDPKHAQAYFLLGKIEERNKEYRRAFSFYDKAVQLDPDNLEYLSKMGLIYLTINDIDKAKDNMEKIFSIDPENIDGLILQAGITYREGNTEKATKMMEEVFYKNPGHEGNSSFLASMYIKDKRYDEARVVLEETITLNKKAILLRSMHVDLLFQNNENDRAIEELKKIIDLAPEIYDYQVKLAKYYDVTGKPDKAEQVLRDAIKSMPDDIDRQLMLVRFIRKGKGNNAAVAELNKMIESNPDVGDYKLAMAELYLSMDMQKEARDMYRKIINVHENDEYGINASIKLISLLMEEKDIEAARTVLDKALKISPNDADLHLVKARFDLLNNNMEQVIISLRTVLKEKPGLAQPYILLAEAYKKEGDDAQAKDTLTRAYNNIRTSPNELYVLAQYYINKKRYDDAEKLIDDAIGIDPSHYNAVLAKSKLLVMKKDYQGASDYADKLIIIDPTKPEGYMQKVPALISSKQYDEAISILEKGYDKVRDNTVLLQTIARIYIDEGDKSKAVNRINEAIASADNTDKKSFLNYLLARIQLSINNEAEAVNSLKSAIKLNPAWENPYIALMQVYHTDAKYDEASNVLRQGIDNVDDKRRLIFYLATTYERMNRRQDAINEYERLYSIQPDNILAVNNLVTLLIESDNNAGIDRAKQLINIIEGVDNPAVQDTVAWYHYKTDNLSNALDIMKNVIQKAPDVPIFNYHIGMIYHKLGENDAAKEHLSVAVKAEGSFTGKNEAKSTLSSI